MKQNNIMYFTTGKDIINLSYYEWTQDVNKHMDKYFELKKIKEDNDTEKPDMIDISTIRELIKSNYELWVKVIDKDTYYNWKHNANIGMIEITLLYTNKELIFYMDNEQIEELEKECRIKDSSYMIAG